MSDWDLLTHKKYLFVLPAKITVASIISEYTKNADKLVTGNKEYISLKIKTQLGGGIKILPLLAIPSNYMSIDFISLFNFPVTIRW